LGELARTSWYPVILASVRFTRVRVVMGTT
jgi:hypothetical protein